MQTLHASIEVDASAEHVWRTITDFASYPDWNPFIVRAEGRLAVGERLHITIAAPGYRPVSFRPRLLDVEPGRRMRWLGRTLLPGLFDGRHSLMVETLGEGRSRFTSHEEVSGILLPVLGKVMRQSQAGFEELCRAVKARAEQPASAG
jgi:hypothetical protein